MELVEKGSGSESPSLDTMNLEVHRLQSQCIADVDYADPPVYPDHSVVFYKQRQLLRDEL